MTYNPCSYFRISHTKIALKTADQIVMQFYIIHTLKFVNASLMEQSPCNALQ